MALVDQAKWISECEAGAGKWAIAWCYSDIFGRNEAYYKYLENKSKWYVPSKDFDRYIQPPREKFYFPKINNIL